MRKRIRLKKLEFGQIVRVINGTKQSKAPYMFIKADHGDDEEIYANLYGCGEPAERYPGQLRVYRVMDTRDQVMPAEGERVLFLRRRRQRDGKLYAPVWTSHARLKEFIRVNNLDFRGEVFSDKSLQDPSLAHSQPSPLLLPAVGGGEVKSFPPPHLRPETLRDELWCGVLFFCKTFPVDKFDSARFSIQKFSLLSHE